MPGRNRPSEAAFCERQRPDKVRQVAQFLPDVAGDCAHRKPIVADRWSGLKPLRVAVRSMMILLFHEPPRTPLYRPLDGPVGFLPGMYA